MPEYVAPYLITPGVVELPDGMFLVPVCTTRERYKLMTDALWQGGFVLYDEGSYAHLVDWLEAIPRITPGCEFDPSDNCNVLYPDNERLTWFPESPYSPGEDVPDGYTFHPWTIVDSSTISEVISIWGLGYKIGDIYTDLTKIPLGASWSDLLGNDYLNFPRFRINDLEGRGTIKIHFLNIPQGGRAWIVVDDVIHINPYANKLVELSADKISFPPETQVEIVVEFDVEGGGTHHVDVIYLPTVDDTFIPLFFGGGLRSIELCGFDMPTDNCCDETNDLLQQMLKIMQNGFTIVPNMSNALPPDLGGGDCAPAFFDHDTDEVDAGVLLQRQRALCITAERYVKGILIAGLVDMGAPSVLIDYIESQLPLTLPPSFSKLQVVYPSIFSGLAAFFAALTGGAELPLIACQMVTALEGDINNTFANFRTSVDAALLTSLIVPLAGMVQASNGLAKNYQLFNLALHDANEEDLSAYTCPCGIEDPPGYCEEPLALFVSDDYGGSTGTTITLVAPNIYHIVQNTPGGGGIHYAAIEDSLGRCLRMEVPGGAYTYQPAVIYNSKGCCDDPDQSATSGDFIGGLYKSVQWAPSGTDPIDTHIKITCEQCCPDLELTPNAAGGDVNTVITLTGTPDVYHIVQDTYQDASNDNRYIASVIDANGLCLKFEQVSGMTQTPIYASQRIGCVDAGDGCDSEDLDGGGAIAFAPTTGVMLGWQSVAPIDTYLKITCCLPD